jgi:hypothetical protein
VSRGLGKLQRRICEVLYAAEGYELPLRELRRRLGEPDRSNLRRAVRGLIEREIAEESRLRGERRVGLTFWGHSYVSNSRAIRRRRRRISLTTELAEAMRAKREAEEAERRWREAENAKWIREVDSEQRFVRKRAAGPTQKRILHVLWEYSEPVEEGLPKSAVKAIVGGDRSNTRRAIKTLLLWGKLEESRDGERIRLSPSTASFFAMVPPLPLGPADDERAREILPGHRDAVSTRGR